MAFGREANTSNLNSHSVYPVDIYLLSITVAGSNIPLTPFSPAALEAFHSRNVFSLVDFILIFTRKEKIDSAPSPSRTTSIQTPELQPGGLRQSLLPQFPTEPQNAILPRYELLPSSTVLTAHSTSIEAVKMQ